ncbi:MAG: HEPN domain-containing protein [Desulfitobacteriaceae bacterium]|nr:HEPN domain-containing protein [Desulfitobacteriaceae bacterium]
MTVLEKSLNLAESFLKRAYKKLGEAEGYLKPAVSNCPESISASQECIELSVKAMFLLLMAEYPKRHWFKDEEFEALLEKVPEKLRHLDFPRLFLYSKFWMGFYETAKYGDEKLGVGPERLFRKEEAELALRHARECL